MTDRRHQVKPKAHLAFDKKKPHNKCTTDLFCDWQTEVCRCLFTLNTAVLNGVFGNWLNEEWRYLLTLNDPVWYFLLLTLHWQVMPKITTSLNLTLSIGWYRSQSNVDSETCTKLNFRVTCFCVRTGRVWFIQVKLIQISYIGHLFQVWIIWFCFIQ